MHKRPAADKFINAARRLRARNSSDEQVIGAGWELYPDKNKDKSNRARLLRACRASDEGFNRAERAYEMGANVVQIVAALETSSLAGAPKGNINARGKKRDASLDRFNNTWRASDDERRAKRILATSQPSTLLTTLRLDNGCGVWNRAKLLALPRRSR